MTRGRKGFALATALVVLVLVGVVATLILQRAADEAERTRRALAGARIRTAMLSATATLRSDLSAGRAVQPSVEWSLDAGDNAMHITANTKSITASTLQIQLQATGRQASGTSELTFEKTAAGWAVVKAELTNGAW